MRRIVVLVCVSCCCLASTTYAQTTPIAGAVSLPAGFEIRLPFPAGVRANVAAGYSGSGGSINHVGTDRPGNTNDYYALDFTLPDFANNGHGQPVAAVASGTVVMAGWATGGWSPFGQIVYIEHDFNSDGHAYFSLYAHLNAVHVSPNQHVDAGFVVADLGGSCDGGLTCSYFGSHLHFSMHQDASHLGGPYGGHAVVPEPLDGSNFITKGQTLVSQNNGQPVAPCAVITTPETILDDQGPCFQRRGTASYWHDESAGYASHSIWTYTVDSATYDNHAIWTLNFAQAGEYDVFAYIPAAFGESARAKYEVRHNGAEDAVRANQSSANDDWLRVGTFTFAQGGDQWVRLADNSGEPYVSATNNTKIVFDALKIATSTGPVCACAVGDVDQTQPCGSCGQQSRSCDGCSWSAWGTCSGEGACAEASMESAECAEGGTHERVCSASCSWSAWSSCGQAVGDTSLGDAGDVVLTTDTSTDDRADTSTYPGDATLADDSSDTVFPHDQVGRGACGCSVRTEASKRSPAALLALGLLAFASRRRKGGRKRRSARRGRLTAC